MSKDTDNKDSPDLLNALESIKGLLEKSESKLSAARESLKKAKSADIKPAIIRPSVSSDPVVPVLDDIVETSTDTTDGEEPLLFDDLPVLENYLEPEETTLAEPQEVPQPTGYSTDEVLAYIDQLHLQLEKELSDSLMHTVVVIEAEIKETLDKEIQKLKEQLGQADKD